MKLCKKCEKLQDKNCFSKALDCLDGLSPWCKSCHAETARNWNQNNKQKHKMHKAKSAKKNYHKTSNPYHLKYKFGLTIEQFNQMVQQQNNCCAICNMPETILRKGSPRRLAVDHCHTTNKIRGLLCMACNTALGLLKENPQIINNLLSYLNEKGA